jgi:hypothetical protein
MVMVFLMVSKWFSFSILSDTINAVLKADGIEQCRLGKP